METKDVTILGVSGEENRHFFFQHVYSARLPQQLHHGVPFIGKCKTLALDRPDAGQKVLFPAAFVHIPAEEHQTVRQFS